MTLRATTAKGARRTFTLVEMLVVISIIALLAAMMMPALDKALQASRVTVCANNQKQLSTVHFQYQNDYNGFLAHCVYADDGSMNDGVFYGWVYKLQPYLGYDVGISSKPNRPGQRGNVFTCPENPEGELTGNLPSFAVNANMGSIVSSICRYPAYKLVKFLTPASKAYLFDGGGYRCRSVDFSYINGPGSNLLYARHTGNSLANVSFFDGHTKAYGGDVIPFVYNSSSNNWLDPNYPAPANLR